MKIGDEVLVKCRLSHISDNIYYVTVGSFYQRGFVGVHKDDIVNITDTEMDAKNIYDKVKNICQMTAEDMGMIGKYTELWTLRSSLLYDTFPKLWGKALQMTNDITHYKNDEYTCRLLCDIALKFAKGEE